MSAPERELELATRERETEQGLRYLQLAGLPASAPEAGYGRIFADLERAGFSRRVTGASLALLEIEGPNAAVEFALKHKGEA